MTKKTYTTILLILFVSVTAFASNRSIDKNCVESTLTSTKDISTIKIEDVKSETFEVSLLMKHVIIKHSSRKSKMNNLYNYLKNPENLERTSTILC